MVDSPAYRLNHEEVIKALEEGIAFAENLTPVEAVPDERGALKAMIFKREAKDRPAGQDATITLPARTVLVAAGTTPNITYEKERPGTFQLDAKKKFFQPHARRRERRRQVPPAAPDAERLLHLATTTTAGSSRYYGDNHPRYAGNVVKAMASAKDGYPARRRAVRATSSRRSIRRSSRSATRRGRALVARLDDELLGASSRTSSG